MLPSKALIGMVHVGALPGTPFATKPLSEIESTAVAEARALADSGFDAIIIENMHDRPYVNAPHGPETTASMTRLVSAVRRAVPNLPLGVQVLSFGHREALAVALASDAQFIRVENFAYAHVADEGLLPDAAAGALLRERRRLGADHIKLFCDVKKKHASHAITADISLADEAHGMEFFGADGLIVTGAFTGQPTEPTDVQAAKAATKLPIWVGSGVTPPQLGTLFQHADALIVGSWIKRAGAWTNPVDPARCVEIVKEAQRVR
jgi:uncharacterized protein